MEKTTEPNVHRRPTPTQILKWEDEGGKVTKPNQDSHAIIQNRLVREPHSKFKLSTVQFWNKVKKQFSQIWT